MPIEQRGLFDEPGAAMPATSSIRAGSAARPLTKNQRQFNRLTTRLEQLRAELACWQRVLDQYRQRFAAEIDPLQRDLRVEQRTTVLFVDALLTESADNGRLTKRRRKKLRDFAVMLAEVVLEACWWRIRSHAGTGVWKTS